MKRRQQTPAGRHRPLAGTVSAAHPVRIRTAPPSGAGLLLSEVEHDPRIRRDYPGLAHAIAEISTPPLRNMGTLGGNLLLDTRCNYYDQNYEWRQAIDFCMKKDGDDLLGRARLAALPGGPVGRLGADPDRARRERSCSRRPPGSGRSPLEDLYRNDGIDYLTKQPDELLTESDSRRPDGWRASLPEAPAPGLLRLPGPLGGCGRAARRGPSRGGAGGPGGCCVGSDPADATREGAGGPSPR